MIGKIGLASVALAATIGVASAQNVPPSTATLIEDFVCPTGNCDTKCVGPAVNYAISAHDVKVFQFAAHPRRLWLLADGQVFVLGDDDSCQFGGATSSPIDFVVPPPETSSLGPPVNPPPPKIGPVTPETSRLQ
jgi:hypothetical protein